MGPWRWPRSRCWPHCWCRPCGWRLYSWRRSGCFRFSLGAFRPQSILQQFAFDRLADAGRGLLLVLVLGEEDVIYGDLLLGLFADETRQIDQSHFATFTFWLFAGTGNSSFLCNWQQQKDNFFIFDSIGIKYLAIYNNEQVPNTIKGLSWMLKERKKSNKW